MHLVAVVHLHSLPIAVLRSVSLELPFDVAQPEECHVWMPLQHREQRSIRRTVAP